MESSTPGGVLDGLRVVELSAFVAVPLAGMTLAQLGAEVIRVDPPGGGLDYRRRPITDSGAGLYWAGLNKGKRSVTIDLRSKEGRSLVRDLITAPGEDGGILITNLSPRWISYDDIRRGPARSDHGRVEGQSGRFDRGGLHGQTPRPAIRRSRESAMIPSTMSCRPGIWWPEEWW